MPVIHVQMLGSAARDSKAQSVQEYTDTIVGVLRKNKQRTPDSAKQQA